MSDYHDARSHSLLERLGECESCRQIWRRLAQPESIHEINLGSIEDALATQCHTHKPLVLAFIEYMRRDLPMLPGFESGDVGIPRGYKGGSVRMSESVHKGGRSWDLLLVKKDAVPQHPGTGRILNPKWVDLGMLQNWKKQCLSAHGARCENHLKIWRTMPSFLIDVRRKCLVPGLASGAFVALSYRYGRTSGTTIDAATLERLQEPYSLDAPDLKECLSPVIRHGIYLTAAISERYLWADALCIPQANKEVRTEELKMMGAIYANAVVTIIAADGDSQDGLPGLEGFSEPRYLNQRIIPFGSEKIIIRNTEIFSPSEHRDDYYSRAWTFQEYSMSQRRIFLKNHELHWECQCSSWHEELILDAEIDRPIKLRQNLIMTGFPDLGFLSDILSCYNVTEARYDEDALPAVSGLLSVLSRSFTGGFLYGIPEMFFERGLGWSPYRDEDELRRRTPSDRPIGSWLSPAELPSWSWIGWQGDFDLDGYREAIRIDDSIPYIDETIPVTEWYTSNCPSDPPEVRRRVRSTWFENRNRYKDLTQALPHGWSRHEGPVTNNMGEPHLYPDECGKYIFKHEAMPDLYGESIAWYYPFPVAEILDSTPPVTPEQTPYLFCKTWRARVWGRQARNGNIAQLYNTSGREVGYLHLHNKESLALFPVTNSVAGHGLLVEVVVVCKSRQYSKTWNAEISMYDHPIRREDMYTVLWVDWKDNIAYRLASGHVKTEDWEKLDTEIIDLVLG